MLLAEITEKQIQNQQARASWREQVEKVKQKIDHQQDLERNISMNPIAPQRVMAALDETVDEEAIMVVDTGDHTIWFNRIFRAKNQQVLYSGKWRTMGFALPASISAKISYPAKQVVAIVGDGSVAMTIMELATAVAYQIPIVVVVMNNQSLAMEKHKMESEHIPPFGTNLHNPNFAQVARAFGAIGIEVRAENQLYSALKEAYASNQPVLIDIHIAAVKPPLSGFEPKKI